MKSVVYASQYFFARGFACRPRFANANLKETGGPRERRLVAEFTVTSRAANLRP